MQIRKLLLSRLSQLTLYSVTKVASVARVIYRQLPIGLERKQKIKTALLKFGWVRKSQLLLNKPANNTNYVLPMADQLNAEKLSVQVVVFYQSHRHFTSKAIPKMMDQQLKLAEQNGVYGFCFYHSGFKGAGFLEQPAYRFLADKSLKTHFCLCWTNERGYPQCDDSVGEGGLAQPQGVQSDLAFIDSVMPFFTDKRYICIGNKPLLMVYQANLLPNIAVIIQSWRQRIKQQGFDDLYLVAMPFFETIDFHLLGFDAGVHFPADRTTTAAIAAHNALIDLNHLGHMSLDQDIRVNDTNFFKFEGVMLCRDQSAGEEGVTKNCIETTLLSYSQKLTRACEATFTHPLQQRLLFINAWNGSDEGTHLASYEQLGRSYLHATTAVLSRYYLDPEIQSFINKNNAKFKPSSHTAILLHCYYEDLISPIFKKHLRARQSDSDLFVTIVHHVSLAALQKMQQLFPNIYFLCCENRGRDIRPFLLMLEKIIELGYLFVCKLHTKKSPQRQDGQQLRQSMFKTLLAVSDGRLQAVQHFLDDPRLGLLAPKTQILEDRKWHVHNSYWLDKLLYRLDCPEQIGVYKIPFPAGSMYWFRVQALFGLGKLVLQEDSFEQEMGQVDGTLAHALERIVALFATQRGYQMKAIDG